MSQFTKEFWIERLGKDWTYALKDTLKSPYMDKLMNFLNVEYALHKIHPFEKKDVFNAFKLCPFNDLKVVIIGVDPALNIGSNGLCFADNYTVTYLGETLYQIRHRIETDFDNGLRLDFDSSLESWAKQGVLLLNIALTARRNEPFSHSKPWNRFTMSVFDAINNYRPGTIFMLWGEHAQKLRPYLKNHHDFIYSTHPVESPSLLVNWESDCFLQANKLLKEKYNEIINW